MSGVVKRWWHNFRYTNCGICGKEFRKGRGGGVSRSTVCSDKCWAQAWADWFDGVCPAEVSEP